MTRVKYAQKIYLVNISQSELSLLDCENRKIDY
jgi:hypothetical protein